MWLIPVALEAAGITSAELSDAPDEQAAEKYGIAVKYFNNLKWDEKEAIAREYSKTLATKIEAIETNLGENSAYIVDLLRQKPKPKVVKTGTMTMKTGKDD